MTEPRQDMPNDPQLSKIYREQGSALPSDALDQRILAFARQAVEDREHVVRRAGWWQRWRLPLSMATTLLLTVSLALLVERQPRESGVNDQQRVERPAASPQAGTLPESSAFGASEFSSEALTEGVKHELKRPSNNVPDRQGGDGAFSASKAKKATPAPVAVGDELPSRQDESKAAAELSASPAARQAAPFAKSRADASRLSPEIWLEQIRALRREGKAEEAKRQLSEFRRAYPDFPLAEEFLD